MAKTHTYDVALTWTGNTGTGTSAYGAFERSVDLSAEAPGLALCRELLERLHVPVISTASIGLHPSLAVGPRDFFAATEREMWNALRACTHGLSATQALWLKRAWFSYEYDWGWTGLWNRCAQLLENVDMHLA